MPVFIISITRCLAAQTDSRRPSPIDFSRAGIWPVSPCQNARLVGNPMNRPAESG